MLTFFIYFLISIFLFLVGSFIPIGNAHGSVRRVPWVTFGIIGACVLIYYGTLPSEAGTMKDIVKSGTELITFVQQNEGLTADEGVRNKLVEAGIMQKAEADAIKKQLKNDTELAGEYETWLATPEAKLLLEELNQKLTAFKTAVEATISYKFGFAPNGHWKIYQLFTCAFLHAGWLHLFGNLICFFSIAFVLEDLWGRGVFLGFYLLGAAAACIPFIISPIQGPLIGASGAISATMGAFLIRLPKTKIKLLFWLKPFRSLLRGKKPVVFVPSWIYLISYFIANLIQWYFDSRSGGRSQVAFSAHIAGFVFGAGFALVMKAGKIEETHINPKLEAKVSFEAPVAVTQGLEMMDKGQTDMAERKLRSFMMQHPDNLETILALIQVYQKTSNYDQLNAMYGRLLRFHLNKNDREAALYAYDSLLSAFPDNQISVRIPPRDWIVICDFLAEMQMHSEASVEYERLARAWPEDANSARAALHGGEAAFTAQDIERALGLFEMAEKMNTSPVFASRITTGLEKCRRILANRPDWKRKHHKPKAPAMT
jgi:membrane associated rhomboid family serine protease